jgi:hypothetical protein
MASGAPIEGSAPNSQGPKPLLERLDLQDQQISHLYSQIETMLELLAQQVATSNTLHGTLGELTTAI